LDKGDIVSLVEKAGELIDKEEAEKLEKKIRKGNFDLNDLLEQMKMLDKFGGFAKILSFIPGASKITDMIGKNGIEERGLKSQKRIIQSMTKKERQNPDILNSSRKFRIARGSGTDIKDVNSLLKKFKTMRQVAASVGNMDKEQLKNIVKNLGDLDGETFNN
jgi:signal recognition particle subunit SRP54